jgi:hypothetical protein
MQSVTTDNIEGFEIVSEQDNLIAIQFRNNTLFNLFLVTEKTQSFQDRGIIVKPNEQWPVAGPSLWAGTLRVYTDAVGQKVTFGLLKSKILSILPPTKKGF